MRSAPPLRPSATMNSSAEPDVRRQPLRLRTVSRKAIATSDATQPPANLPDTEGELHAKLVRRVSRLVEAHLLLRGDAVDRERRGRVVDL